MNKRPASALSEPLKLSPISADLFFPPPTQEWKQRLEFLCQKSPEKPNAAKLQPAPFRTFPKQDLAFEFVDRCPEVSHVFSFETGAGLGSRKFLASSYEDFWQRYSEMYPESRVHYEVIRDGSPCHLYFDLEFKREYNPERDGDKLRDIFCKFMWQHLALQYSVKVDDTNTIILDSSTPKKYSNHVIINIPHCAFTNNIHAGDFVREVYNTLERQREHDPEVESLFLDADKNEKVFIADMGVYTRNRNFRLFLSSKHGQNSYLTYVNKTNTPVNDKDIFYKSLICNVEFSSKLRLLSHGEVTKSPHKKIASSTGPQATHSSGITCTRSPFPELDDFIATKISRGGVPGHIRSVIFFPTSKVIVYGVGHNRYCENIGRAHKSNHTLMVCDCQGGVYYQRCFDYDCRNFRGTEHPLPLELCPFRPASSTSDDPPTQPLKKVLEDDAWLMTDAELASAEEIFGDTSVS